MKVSDGLGPIDTLMVHCLRAAAAEDERRRAAGIEVPAGPLTPEDRQQVDDFTALMEPFFEAQERLQALLRQVEDVAFRALSANERDRLRMDRDAYGAWHRDVQVPPELEGRVADLVAEARREFHASVLRMGEYLKRLRGE